MPDKQVVLVTAATGNVGPHAVRELVAAGATVRAFVLKDDPLADRLPSEVELYHGDLADPSTLEPALDGVGGVFLMWPFFNLGTETAPEVVDLIAASAERVALVSSVGVHIGLEPVDNNCHAYLESLLEKTNLGWTFLRTTGFHVNARGFAQQIRDGGVVRFPYGDASRTSVHEGDLAAVGAAALVTGQHTGKAYLVSGPEAISQREQVRVIGEVVGRELGWEDVARDEAKAAMVSAGWPPSYADGALDYFAQLTKEPEVGSDVVRQVTGRPARTFRQWVEENAEVFR